MKQTLAIVAAMVAGFFGGLAGTRLVGIGGASPAVVRARSFELVDQGGRVISFWGVDQWNSAVLAFGSREGLAGSDTQGLRNPERQLLALSVHGGDLPALQMRGADGKIRVWLMVNLYSKPALSMWDESQARLLLGIDQSDTPGPQDNNWTLAFRQPQDMVSIGMGTVEDKGHTYNVGGIYVNPKRVEYPH